jgi:DNA-binding MarR family transcriptional regulator
VTGGQASLLGTLRAHPEYGVGELAALERVSAPAMTQYLDRLERAGLIRRDRSTDDARRVRLLLTEQGHAALDAIRNRRTAWLAERIDALSPGDRDVLAEAADVLERLIGADE